jgi:hypothetical protein
MPPSSPHNNFLKFKTLSALRQTELVTVKCRYVNRTTRKIPQSIQHTTMDGGRIFVNITPQKRMGSPINYMTVNQTDQDVHSGTSQHQQVSVQSRYIINQV